MSTRKGAGNTRTRAPKHQNNFAFKHNKNSKKTEKIQNIHHGGLCQRCHEQIEWRKKYRKYKPLKAPKKCRGCEKKSVFRAYHVICNSCGGGQGVCVKCLKKHGEGEEGDDDDEQSSNSRGRVAQVSDVEPLLSGMKEREKRAILRKVERGDMMLVHMEDGTFELTEVEHEDGSDNESGDDENEGDGSENDNNATNEEEDLNSKSVNVAKVEAEDFVEEGQFSHVIESNIPVVEVEAEQAKQLDNDATQVELHSLTSAAEGSSNNNDDLQSSAGVEVVSELAQEPSATTAETGTTIPEEPPSVPSQDN